MIGARRGLPALLILQTRIECKAKKGVSKKRSRRGGIEAEAGTEVDRIMKQGEECFVPIFSEQSEFCTLERMR